MALDEKPLEKNCEGMVGSDSNSLWTPSNVCNFQTLRCLVILDKILV